MFKKILFVKDLGVTIVLDTQKHGKAKVLYYGFCIYLPSMENRTFVPRIYPLRHIALQILITTIGNGRIHRYPIHHILREKGFNPPGIIFPIARAMLDRIDEYRAVLRGYSQGILPCIKWKTTEDHNVRVLNSTIDYYRYYDATPYVLFLYRCIKETIEHDLPQEAQFLVKYDQFRSAVQRTLEMPDRIVFLLYSFLSQNRGKLSKRAQEKEFFKLSDTEITQFENLYEQLFIDTNSI